MHEAHMQLVSAGQMARIDRRAIDGGMPGVVLMEAAGAGVARVLEGVLDGFPGRRIAILCGKGNNGGDGFVVARLAVSGGSEVRTFLFGTAEDLKGDARSEYIQALEAGLTVEEAHSAKDLGAVQEALDRADAAVDALLGTGIRGGARGTTADGIGLLEKARCPIVAVDVPSGMDSDTGRAEGPCAAASCTVTFGLPKAGQFLFPGKGLCGRLHLVDIGLPPCAAAAEPSHVYVIAALGAAPLLPRREPHFHKGDCGRVAIVAGSVGFTGAATLAATGALRAGAGLVTVGVPESLNDVLEVKLTEAMTWPLPEVRRARCLSLRARGEIGRLASGADCLALGPGLGTHRETVELVRRLVAEVRVPTVLDADALNALAGEADRLKTAVAPMAITPHPGEFSRLTGADLSDVLSDPLESARSLSKASGVTVLLKGAPTVVADPDGDVFVNPSGNAGMATGGTGDVLTGVLAALIGQGLEVAAAARLAVYLHGLAGDLAAEGRGEAGLVAGDVASALPGAERMVRSERDEGRYIRFHPEG